MPSNLPSIHVQRPVKNCLPIPARRSFLRYTGASAVVGSLWLAGCTKKEDAAPAAAAPTTTSFSPVSGMPGATVTLTGTGFAGATAVLLGTLPTTFVVVNATTITFTVPASAQTAAVTVATPTGTATTGATFTVVPAPPGAPTIASFTPASAMPGATVTVTGTNFTGATALTVGGVAAAPTVVNATTITFAVPPTAQTGVIVVTAPGGTATSGTSFTVLPVIINVGTGDVGVLNYAYALEQLEAAFYTLVRTGSYYTGLATTSAEHQILDDLYYHEVIHREFFKGAIPAANRITDALVPDFSTIDFTSRTSVLGAAKAFEDLGVAAYNGAGKFITNTGYLFIAGKIVSVEARHAALIRDLVQQNTFIGSDIVDNYSLERSMLPSQVAPIVNSFLMNGSKLDVSGLG